MSQQFGSREGARGRATNAKIVLGAVVGAVGGLVATTVALGSFEFGILGAIGGGLFVMIGALVQSERGEV
jgi:hypothetical protein